jgi:methylmalonyl-CoA mutase
VTGDQVLPLDVYNDIKENLVTSSWNGSSRYFKRRPGTKHLYFSTEFALRLMGDVQEYFIKKNVRNFYSVSISGIILLRQEQIQLQLAFTLSNGFTYVEYYLSRGMSINDFGPNLSFFSRMELIRVCGYRS